MRNLNNLGVYKALLLAGSAGAFAFASPAWAQASNAGPSNNTGQGPDCAAHPEDTRCVGANSETPSPTPSTGTIVVTGSRIARQDYNSNSPMVTVDDKFLKESSTAAVEQQLNKLPQFVVSQSSTTKNNDATGLIPAGGDIQPNATNTPGAATVSLRGVGANRTLVLIDGRRGVPTNASGAVDVSTIPSAALERVEVISGGASATYGADAIAGVTNFILRKNFKGLELDAQAGISQEGVGFEYQLSGIMGADFPDGRGNVSLAMSLNTRELELQKDLPIYQRQWADPNNTSGSFFFIPRPGVSGVTVPQGTINALFPNATVAIPAASTTSFYVNQDGSVFTTGFTSRGGSYAYKPWPGSLADSYGFVTNTAVGSLKFINAITPATIPTDRYNFLARGNYEITDFVGVFGQVMFSNSNTYTVQEPGPLTFGWDVLVPWGSGTYTGQVTGLLNNYQNNYVPPAGINGVANPAFIAKYKGILPCATPGNPQYNPAGCTNTQAFQAVIPQSIQTLLNARATPNAPFSLAGYLPLPRATYSDVKTYSMIAGLEGSIPGTDWTWEAFVNHGISQTISRQTGMYSLERTRAVFSAPNFGQGFTATGNAFGGIGGLSSGFGASTATCTTGLNFFQDYAGASQNCFSAITADARTQSTARQTIAEANLQGGLFPLPAGQLRFAIGASYREERYEFLNDELSEAGQSFNDQLIGIYPSQNMENQGYDVRELYGELLIPVLKDIPFIRHFNLEIGGRMSDYTTTGTSYTYKALADWEVTNWLRLRGGFNRAERAPNIAELLLTPQQSFSTDPIGDVCSSRLSNTFSANPTANPNALNTRAICLELMARDNGGVFAPVTNPNGTPNTFSYYDPTNAVARQPAGPGFSFNYASGNEVYRNLYPNTSIGALKPEIADTWTAGAVIRSPITSGPLSRFTITVDYFNIKINNPIGSLGPGAIELRCLDPEFNPAAAGVAGSASQAAIDAGTDAGVRARAQAAIAGGTCPLVLRTATNAFANGTLNSNAITGTYANIGKIALSGIDATLNWSDRVGPGTLFLSVNANYMFSFKVQADAGQPYLEYVGTFGTNALGVNSGSSFRYRVLTSLGYSVGKATVTLQWTHTPPLANSGDVLYLNGITTAPGVSLGVGSYDLFNLNASYQVNDNVRVRLGVDNLFNRAPDLTGVLRAPNAAIGQVSGGSYDLLEDTQGRRFSAGVNLRF